MATTIEVRYWKTLKRHPLSAAYEDITGATWDAMIGKWPSKASFFGRTIGFLVVLIHFIATFRVEPHSGLVDWRISIYPAFFLGTMLVTRISRSLAAYLREKNLIRA